MLDLQGIQMLTTVNSFEAIAGRDASSTKSAARGLLRLVCLSRTDRSGWQFVTPLVRIP